MSVTAETAELSLAEKLALSPKKVSRHFFDSLSEEEHEALKWNWQFWGRPSQFPPPGDWLGWLIMTGRGWGKNRTAGEFLRNEVMDERTRFSGLVARTSADVRDVMVEGESGILRICPPNFRPVWEPSRRRLLWPNGAISKTYSAEEPDVLRGPQHDLIWGDEVASWKWRAAWDNAMLGLRKKVGNLQPRWVVTTTPKPNSLIREFLRKADAGTVHLTQGSTYDNRGNLAEAYIEQIVKPMEGTRLASQELHGKLMKADPNALWKPERLEECRVSLAPENFRIIIGAVDPQIKFTEMDEGTETGIMFGGVADDGLAYLLGDYTIRGKPEVWATEVVKAFHNLKANYVVAETNNGGDMVISTIQQVDRLIPVKKITASRGKYTRAEPVAVMMDKDIVKLVGYYAELESQMVTWVPGEKSPDRLDAFVWLMTELLGPEGVKVYGRDYAIS